MCRFNSVTQKPEDDAFSPKICFFYVYSQARCLCRIVKSKHVDISVIHLPQLQWTTQSRVWSLDVNTLSCLLKSQQHSPDFNTSSWGSFTGPDECFVRNFFQQLLERAGWNSILCSAPCYDPTACHQLQTGQRCSDSICSLKLRLGDHGYAFPHVNSRRAFLSSHI